LLPPKITFDALKIITFSLFDIKLSDAPVSPAEEGIPSSGDESALSWTQM